MSDIKCQNCNCFVKIESEMNQYECRGLPPQLVAIPQQGPAGPMISVNSMYPRVHPDGWCSIFDRNTDLIDS